MSVVARPSTAEAASAHKPWPTVNTSNWQCAADETPFDCDRRAILAMVGEFEVSFHFDEKTVLAPGYVRREPQRSGAYETVVLVEDRGTHIDLQHLLVVGDGQVVKHWRQTWDFEATQRWSYIGDQRFSTKNPIADAKGAWTQSVFEVSDAPRYTGTGRWVHAQGVAAWTADPTWRPLPRREYTTRDDYDVLAAINRHTITPTGWAHEQDNIKLQRGADGTTHALTRENGFNDYRRIRGFDFSPAYRYWRETAPYWRGVRERWTTRLSLSGGLHLDFAIADGALYQALFEGASAFREQPDLAKAMTAVDALFARHVRRATLRTELSRR